MGDFSSLIRRKSSAKRRPRAAGTLFGNNMLRLVQKNGCRLESFLDGMLMIFTHRDVPGIIGSVGTIFGPQGQHRADGRRPSRRTSRGGEAVGVLSLELGAAGRGPGGNPGYAAGHAGLDSEAAAGELPSRLGGLRAWLGG